jgi:hypothetical protein
MVAIPLHDPSRQSVVLVRNGHAATCTHLYRPQRREKTTPPASSRAPHNEILHISEEHITQAWKEEHGRYAN